ncbi:hypothetical protein SLEP1_g55992 [Rubroshorea leprosula]|uniref:Transposase (putative) gypsy type domain-containing protein n=1 Tax=Rubroshorea leprosula TaxID=152421 RepID=A0AAV5MJC9_9ROSI|nr:hypothetical protein SLEP1_g55992 [Rubroshorea leprosula]
MVRAYHIPKNIWLRTGGQNERACTVSQTGWIPVYVDHFDAGLRFPLPGFVFDLLAEYELALTQLTPNSIRFVTGFMLLCARLGVPAKAIVFRSLFQCRLCPKPQGARWYYLSGRDKSQLFKNVRNKVARWKRQFVFVRDTRTERISNDLAARLSEWRTPNAHINYPQLLPRDVDLKNQLLQYAQGEGLIDLEALVTSEQLAVFGFVDMTNLISEGEMSSILERQRQRAQSSRGRGASSAQPRQTRFDERPPPAPQPCSSSHRGSSSSSRPRADNRAEAAAPSARRRAREEIESEEDEVPLARRMRSGGTQPAQAARPTTLKATHGRSVAMARAQGAEWLVGSAIFQEAVAVASANVTTDIYNEIRGKVLHHRPDFPIRELVFFDEEELDEQGKSLAPLADTTVRLRWDLNEEGVPVWPPSVLEDGEDPTGLASFDAWVEGAPVAEQEPSSTPPNSQPVVVSSSSPVNAPASEPVSRSSPARSSAAATDASMPVDLTDD